VSAPGLLRRAEWAQRAERSNPIMLRVMTWISLWLGRPVARAVLAGISLYFLLFSPSARRASQAYLTRVLVRPPGIGELFRHFHAFAACTHDRLYLLNDRLDLFDIQLYGADAVEEVLAGGRGAFLVGAHMGSFEAVRTLGRRRPGLRIAMVMYEENARKINAALAAINPRAIAEVVPLGRLGSMLEVNARLDGGEVLGMLGDRTLADDTTLSVPFLGQPAAFPVGPMRLAAMLKRPVLFMTGLYMGGNRYAVHFERLADFRTVAPPDRDAAIHQAIADYAKRLERHCRTQPFNWFNFYDFWRQSPA
jgi:predicted LPLAT superfamily acyltransferase